MEFITLEGAAADKAVAYSNLKQRWARLDAVRTRNDAARVEALREAQSRGLSLRNIATATGLSHQRVHQLIT